MSAPVESAVASIREHLQQDSFIVQYNDVTHDDLKSINGVLKGMTPAERNEVISKLSAEELQTWTSELDNGGFLGMGEGLSADERRDLHGMLASSLDAKQLSRVYDAYDDREQKLELANAIATHASPSTRVDFVKQLAPETTDKSGREIEGFIVYSSNDGDTEGRAVAEILGSMKQTPQALEEAYGALNDQQLNAVFEAAVQHEMHTSGGGIGGLSLPRASYSYDVKPLTKAIDAAATSDDPALKARVFELAGRHLGTISGASGIGNAILAPTPGAGKEAKALAESMSKLYGTDVNGITSGLERNYQAGKGMAPFLEHLLSEGGKEGKATVRSYIAQLSAGNDGKDDPFKRFTQPEGQDGGVYYPNAEKLGYFAGSLHEAIGSISTTRKEQAALVNDIFGAATGNIPIPGVSDAAGFVSKQAVDAAVKGMEAGDVELFEALVDLTIPTDPRTKNVYDGPAENSYNEGWFSVTRQKIN
jgi:hypothetical protein